LITKTLHAVLWLFVFQPMTGFCEEGAAASPAEDSEEMQVEEEQGDTSPAKRSKENRIGKQYTVGVEGLPFLTSDAGMHVGIYFLPDLRFDFEYFSRSGESYDLAALTAFAKYFTGNSFNLNFGFGIGRLQDNPDYVILRNPVARKEYLDVAYRDTRSINAAVGMGNEWSWERYKFGINWITGYWHLWRTVKVTEGPSGIDDNYDLDVPWFYGKALTFTLGVSL
jgi:hypothetical protein